MFVIFYVGYLRMPTETVYIRKENRMRLRKAEERTGLSLARLLNLFVEEGYLEKVVAKHAKGSLRSAY